METGGATPDDMFRRSEDVARQMWKRSPSFDAMGTGLTCLDHDLGVDGACDAVSPLRRGSSEAQKDWHDVLCGSFSRRAWIHMRREPLDGPHCYLEACLRRWNLCAFLVLLGASCLLCNRKASVLAIPALGRFRSLLRDKGSYRVIGVDGTFKVLVSAQGQGQHGRRDTSNAGAALHVRCDSPHKRWVLFLHRTFQQ